MKVITTILFILFFFILSPEATGTIYGPERGQCYKPDNSKEIVPSADLRKEIDKLSAGETLILSPGNYTIKDDITIPAGTSIIAKRINDHCSNDVMIETTGMITLSNYTKLNGLNIRRETPCSKDCYSSSVIKIGKNVKGVGILNNRIKGASGDKIYITSNAEDIAIKGNEFIGGNRWMIGVRGNPTKNVLIEKNRFENCGDDCIQAENQINLYITDNEFYGGKNTVQVLDIKVAKGDSVIKNNIIDCRNIKSGCVLYHANDYEFPKDAKAVFSNNTLKGCASKFIIMGGNKKYKYRNLIVRDNIFVSMGNKCEIQLHNCINCYFHNNEIIGGKLKVDKGIEKGVLQLNKFVNTTFANDGGDIKCIGNAAKHTSGKVCNNEESAIVSVPEVLINHPSSSKNADDSES
jgi:hypothetical protein